MASRTTNWRTRIRKRLSADPSTLGLDDRTEEEPEDLFVRLAAKDDRRSIVVALRYLLLETIVKSVSGGSKSDVVFLKRAIRLCDALRVRECKEVLKHILIFGEDGPWDDSLAILQELAARALSSLPKTESDLRFWDEVAQRKNTSLPYALNAALQIDLQAGLTLLCTIHLDLCDWGRARASKVADWESILRMARDEYGENEFIDALKVAAGDVPGVDTPQQRRACYEHFGQLAGLPRPSQRRKRPVEDVVFYSSPPAGLSSLSSSSSSSTQRHLASLTGLSAATLLGSKSVGDTLNYASEETEPLQVENTRLKYIPGKTG